MVKNFIIATRLPFLSATIIPILFGFTLAWFFNYDVNFIFLLLTILIVSFIHLASNLSNDFFDNLSGNDILNKNYSKFNGGSRVIQNKIFSPKKIINLSIVFYLLALLLSVFLSYLVSNYFVILFTSIGIFLGFFYTAPPLKFSYRTIGEIVLGFSFGILLIFFTFFIQTQIFDFRILFLSLPLTFLVTNIIIVNEFPDYEADKKANKKSLVVRFGKKSSFIIYSILLLSSYAIIPILIFQKIINLWSLIIFLSFPLAIKSYNLVCDNYYKKNKKEIKANELTIKLHLIYGVLFIISLII